MSVSHQQQQYHQGDFAKRAAAAPLVLSLPCTTTLTSAEIGEGAIPSILGKGVDHSASVNHLSRRLIAKTKKTSVVDDKRFQIPNHGDVAVVTPRGRVVAKMNSDIDCTLSSSCRPKSTECMPGDSPGESSSTLPSTSPVSSCSSLSTLTPIAVPSSSASAPVPVLDPLQDNTPLPFSLETPSLSSSVTTTSTSGSSSSSATPISSPTRHECYHTHSEPLSSFPPHSSRPRPRPRHVRSLFFDQKNPAARASEISFLESTSTSTSPSPFIVVHRSKSINIFPTSSSSSVLNISPVECRSLSPTTATPAEVAYFSPRPPRSSSSLRSLFFTSVSSSLSGFSLSSYPQSNATAPPPDYLTYFFAENTSLPSTALPALAPEPTASLSYASATTRASHTKGSQTFAVAKSRQERFRPVTIACVTPSSSSHTACQSTSFAPITTPTRELASATIPEAASGLYSSWSLLPQLSNDSGNTNPQELTESATSETRTRHNSIAANSSFSCIFPDKSTHTRNRTRSSTKYRSRHNKAASLYQPTMIPEKGKQSVLSFVTTEQSKYGPARSTQSTISGGDWGEPTIPGSTGHGVEPNSAASGQEPWMLVTGSGSSYISDMHDSNSSNINSANSHSSDIPSGISTPLLVREEQLNRLPTLQLLDRNEDTDPVLDLEIAHKIRLELPRRLRNATKWNLIYSSDQHGISMTTLFHRCKGKGPMVLAIKDTTDAVFGAYVTEEFKPNLSYYGNGECFLWNVTTLATSPQPPASPAFGPSPLPSPSPFQLASTVTTPNVGPSPSSSSSSFGKGSNSNGQRSDRRHDLFQAMNDQLNTGNIHIARSPSPLSSTTHQHLASSPSSSPALRPTTSTEDGQTPTGMTPGSMGLPHQSGGKRKKKQKVVQFWKWSGKNDYMILSEPGFIALGGGDGKFGLWIHSDLERGHSSRCATFDNEPLAAACHRPLKAVNEQQSQSHGNMNASSLIAVTTPMKKTGGRSRSSSPKDDKEEFYCQTVEIWAMVL